MNPMTRAFIGAALAVALLGSVSAYAASTPAGGGSTPAPAATTDTTTPAPTPPATLHCTAPKVATQVKNKKTGKMQWKCVAPPAPPAAPATPQ
jgi:hypothetical protein